MATAITGKPVVVQAVAAIPPVAIAGAPVVVQAIAPTVAPALVGAGVVVQAVAPVGRVALVGTPTVVQAIAAVPLGPALTGSGVVVQAVAARSSQPSTYLRLDPARKRLVPQSLVYIDSTTKRLVPQALYRADSVSKTVRTIIGPAAPPAPPVVSTKPVMGITGGSASAFNTIDGIVGPVRVRRTYTGSATIPASFAASPAGADPAAGRWSIYSIRLDAATFATDAAAQAKLSAFVDTIPATHRVLFHWIHEPEDEINNGTFTLAQWGAMNNKANAIVRAKNRPLLQVGPCFQGPYTIDPSSPYASINWDSVIDWSLVDVIGLDPYRTSTGKATTWERLMTWGRSGSSSALPGIMDWCIARGKPVMLSEFGVFNKVDGSGVTITEAQKIAFIQGCYSWATSWNAAHVQNGLPGPGYVLGAAYFNFTLIGSDCPLSTTAQQQAYKAIVDDSKV